MTPSADDADDTRRKFREALERKKHRAKGDGSGEADGLAAKPHHASGPAKAQKTFRRKSG